MFSEMFGSIFGWRKEQEEDLRKPLIAGANAAGKEPLGRRICKALRSFWITQNASIYILKLPPPHVRACLFDDLSSFCNRPKKTPESIKYMLKNHDIAEAFIVTVLRYLGFKQVGSNIDLHRLSDSGRYLAHTLAENCFTRDLLEKYKSIDWAAAAAAGDLPVPQEMPLELVARLPADGQWRQPLADWIKRFASIIHSKVFPLEPYAEIEAKVNFLLYSFIHDLMEAQLQVFGRIML